MMNKKGAEMTIGTIVIIVLAIAVLVFLIFGFTMGWSNFWDKIGIFGGGGENVAEISQACAMSCAQQDTYGFCQQERELITEKGPQGSHSCEQWVMVDSRFGIGECSGLCSTGNGFAASGEGEW